MNAEAAPRATARKRRGRWAIIGGIVLVVIVAVTAAVIILMPKSSSTSSLSTATVQRQTLKVLVSGTGTAVVADSVSVSPQVSGTVTKLYVSLGKSVSAGDKLYKISSSDAEAALLKAEASLLQSKQAKQQALQNEKQANNQVYAANTAQIQAQQNLDDLESQTTTRPGGQEALDDKIVLAKRQVQSSKAAVSSAKSSVTAAEIGVEVAQANLTSAQQAYNDAVDGTHNTTVTSPIDGVVTALPISVGSEVNAGTTSSSSSSAGGTTGGSTSGQASSSSSGGSSSGSGSGSSITVSDLGTLKVQVSVSEVDVPSIAINQTATVTFDAITGSEFPGSVKSIAPNGTSSSGVVSYVVTIKLKNQDPQLRPDMTATADILTKVANNVLAVPSAAVKTINSQKYVNVVAQDGTIKQQPVTVGLSDDTYTEIKTGVSEGDTVSLGSTTSSTSSSTSSGNGRVGGGFMMGGPPGGPGN